MLDPRTLSARSPSIRPARVANTTPMVTHSTACVASDTPVKPVDTEAINVQAYWEQPSQPPSAEPGMHRIPLEVVTPRRFGFGARRPAPSPVDACHPAGAKEPETAVHSTGEEHGATGLQPGEYRVILTVDGQTITQQVTIMPDPRALPKGADALPEQDDDE